MEDKVSTVDDLRRRVVLAREAGGKNGNKFPVELKWQVIALAKEARTSGQSLSAVAEALGMSATTLHKWVAGARGSANRCLT